MRMADTNSHTQTAIHGNTQKFALIHLNSYTLVHSKL
jgi:hypothetical protein